MHFSSYRFVPDFSVQARARRRHGNPSSEAQCSPFEKSRAHSVPLCAPGAERLKTMPDLRKARRVPVGPLSSRNLYVCVCAHACVRACVRVFRNRYNRYIPLLYPRTSSKNQGCRARTVCRFFKIEAQKWNTSHPDTSSQKPSRSGKKASCEPVPVFGVRSGTRGSHLSSSSPSRFRVLRGDERDRLQSTWVGIEWVAPRR